MGKKILITDEIAGKSVEQLEKKYEVTIGTPGYYNNEKNLARDIEPYDALLCMLTNPVTDQVIDNGKNLKIIANYAVGYDNIDIGSAQEHGIRVSNTPGVLTDSTADCTITLLLSAARKLTEAEHYIRSGKFHGWEPMGFLGLELQEATLGIIGMGRIGKAVARRARSFGMHILYHNRNRMPEEQENKLQAQYVEHLEDLAEKSDVLSIHCPLTPETRHLIDSEILDIMPDHSLLINTSRGPVVDESALADALHNKTIGGAGLDVFEEEPEVHPHIKTAPNCTITPHIGSATRKTRKAMTNLAVTAIEDILAGKNETYHNNLVV